MLSGKVSWRQTSNQNPGLQAQFFDVLFFPFSAIHAQFKPQIPLKNFFKQPFLALLFVLPVGRQPLSLFQLFLPHLLSCSRKCVHMSILHLLIWGISEITNEPSVTEELWPWLPSTPLLCPIPSLRLGLRSQVPAKGLWSHQAYVNIKYLNLCSSWVRYQVLRGAPHDPDLFGFWVSDVSIGVQIVRSRSPQNYSNVLACRGWQVRVSRVRATCVPQDRGKEYSPPCLFDIRVWLCLHLSILNMVVYTSCHV